MKKLIKKNIIIDVERMKYSNTGLHNYCKNLVEFLVQDSMYNYFFYAPKKIKISNIFGRLHTKVYHKLFLKPSKKFSLWHSTYQTAKYIPVKPIKFVLTIHDLNFLYENKSHVKKNKLIRKIQKAIDRADYITTISEFVLEDLKKHLDISEKKVKVIYNGVNLTFYPNFNSPSYKPKEGFLFTIGTVLPKKIVLPN